MSVVRDVINYILENADNDYSEILKKDGRWEVFYHLSPMRCSILNWYNFKKAGNLLEIGGELGALTGMFCERCASVTTVVKSVEEAEAVSVRCQNKENLEIIISEYNKLQLEKKYDYIVLIGCFETMFEGTAEKKKYAEYLKYLKTFLKQGGTLLLAVSNRYGLKYFCGAIDEFGNAPFAGINGYPEKSGGYAFARNELKTVIDKSGFKNHKFYYPLPDYILTQTVYSENYLPKGNISDRVMPYYSDKRGIVAVEAELYDAVIANDAFEFLTNSFLVECSDEDSLSDIVYTALSTDRGCEHGFATSMHSSGIVSKKALFQEGVDNLRLAYDNIADLKKHGICVIEHEWKNDEVEMPFVKQPNLMDYLYEVIKRDTSEFLDLTDRIYQCILQSSKHVESECNELRTAEGLDCDYGIILENAYIDMVPMNCFWLEGDFYFFDQEFVKKNYPAKYVMFRNILYFYNFHPDAESLIAQSEIRERYGLTALWNIFMEEEQRFVSDNRNWELYGHFYGWTMLDKDAIYRRNMLGNSSEYIVEQNNFKEENLIEKQQKTDCVSLYEKSDILERIQVVEKRILAKFHEVCVKYNLSYFAVYGSLLGAVRHQDIIPWDDDIDVAMPREDYDRLIELSNEVFEEPYFLQQPENDEECFYGGYMKLRYNLSTGMELRNLGRHCNHGVWIDIFPLDNFICENEWRKNTINKIQKYQELLFAKSYGKNLPPNLYGMTEKAWKKRNIQSKFLSRNWLCSRLKDCIVSGNAEPSSYVSIMARYFPARNHTFFTKEAFARAIEVPFGEGSIMIPVGYKECLNIMEGLDHMTIPPEEMRKPHHKAFYAPEVPYKVYVKRFCNIFSEAKDKCIVVWGAGSVAERYLKKYGAQYNPKFLVDDDMAKWGLVRFEHMIKSPTVLQNIPKEQLHLIICSKYYRIIEEELAHLGIDEYYIYVDDEATMVENL